MTRLVLLCTFLLTGGKGFSAPYLRYPAPSPDGSRIAFSANGDLWIAPTAGGAAVQLTSNPGYDARPVWSPCGNWLAFSSDRYGNDDIFIVRSDGTELKRLTHHTDDDTVCDWSPDGVTVLFSSRRASTWQSIPCLYEVPAAGGTPLNLFLDFGSCATYSPDGKQIAYVPRSRYSGYFTKGYQGSGDMDIVLYDRGSGEHHTVTSWKGDDAHCMWLPHGKGFYYLADHRKISNLWYQDLTSGRHEQRTAYTAGDITFPRIARNGDLIAFEYEAGISLYETATGAIRPLAVSVGADFAENPIRHQTYTSRADSYTLGHTEEQIVFTVHGELCVQRLVEKAATRLLTRTPEREEHPVLSPDERTLYFVGGTGGTRDIFAMRSADPREPRLAYALRTAVTRLTSGGGDVSRPHLSPDGSRLLFVAGNGDLTIMTTEGTERRPLVKGWNVSTFSWSPDGTSIAFSREDDDFNEDIYIVPAAGGTPVNVTRHPAYDTAPRWSPDGKYLAFLSQRLDYQYDVYYVWLTREEEEKTEEQRRHEMKLAKQTEKKPVEPPPPVDNHGEKKPAVNVRIDFEDIWYRIHRLTRLPGDEGELTLSHDARRVAFVSAKDGERDLYVVERTGEDLRKLTNGGAAPTALRFGKGDEWLYFLSKDGVVSRIKPDGKEQKRFPFGVSLAHDARRVREEVFREGWRVLNSRFYDPAFHGVDWAGMLTKYLPWARHAAARRDFDTVMLHMMGELNASHLGISPPKNTPPAPPTGHLGIRSVPTEDGTGLRVISVVPDGPAAGPTSRLLPGDVIRHIDGRAVSLRTSACALLAGTAGRTVAVGIERDGAERLLGIRPVPSGALRNLLYDEYVERARDYVDTRSARRLGYVHIRAMGKPHYDRFQMELFSEAHGKDGLVIDVRDNGGGWITDLLLELLAQRRHAYTVPRDGGRGYPDFARKQVYTWGKPFIVLCNQSSYSNAEIFSHAVKTLGLAKLVGVPTNGAVISTGSTTLLDGSRFRVPFRGWYVYTTGENMEEQGAVPHHIVENPPEIWERYGADLQIDKAVDVLLEELGQR